MDNHEAEARALEADLEDAYAQLNIDELTHTWVKLIKKSEKPDFWNDSQAAQETMKEIAKLERRVKPWQELKNELGDLLDLLQIADESLLDELGEQLDDMELKFEQLKENLKLTGAHDDYDAIVSIHAGAGGTDAQDWAEMLRRMYLRYCEKEDFKVVQVEESAGEEAGIKSATFEVSGSYAYGKLKGEHGVHRLVRLSPFNSDNLRQTSFAKVEVMPKIERAEEVAIDDKDLKIDVYRSGGHGGQSVNTTDSAVRITHLPTGIVVAIQNERSQLQNKDTAMTILRSRLAQLQLEQHKEHLSDLKGPNQSAEWGNQIRSYVLHPYKQVKDLRTRYETTEVDSVLNGNLNPFVDAYLNYLLEA